MANKYVSFVSDEHLISCIKNLHQSYLKAKSGVAKKDFYKNKVDTIKLLFDSKFNSIDEVDLIQTEILRQIDKSINNSIGTFHEEVLGGIEGFEKGTNSGYDIKALDNTLFADVKNKHNTVNSGSQESLFQKLARFADDNKSAKCYWVQILSPQSFNIPWKSIINGKEYSHSRVYKISGDRFYELLTGQADAFKDLYNALPSAIDDYLKTVGTEGNAKIKSSVTSEISDLALKNNRTILDQITFENYSYYLGFKEI